MKPQYIVALVCAGIISVGIVVYGIASIPAKTPEQIRAQTEQRRVEAEIQLQKEKQRAEAEAAIPESVRVAEQNKEAVSSVANTALTGLLIYHMFK